MIDFTNSKNDVRKLGDKPEFTFAWQLREALARKISLTIWGDGYLFQTDNKKISDVFKKTEFLNQLENTLSFIERNCSMYGRAIITINKTKTGEYMLNVAEPFYFSGVGKAFIQPQLAVIWQRFVVDTKHYLVESRYDTQKVVNNVYVDENNTKTRVLGQETEILKQFQMEKEWVHNLGFVPVVEFVNIPKFQTKMMNEGYVEITDWYPAASYEKTIYIVKKNLEKEMEYCHSRIVIENATQRLISKLTQNMDIVNGDLVISTDTGAQVSYQQGANDYTKYINSMEGLFDIYFKLAGQSRFSEGGGAQKTVAETATIRTATIEQTKQKIRLRQNQVKDLLRKIFACYGVIKNYWEFADGEEFDFRINGNITKDETSYIDNQMKLIQLGVKTEVDLVQDIFNIPKDEAEKKFQSNKDWLEQNSMGLEEFGLEKDENDDNAIDKTTGEHKDDPSKRGEAA